MPKCWPFELVESNQTNPSSPYWRTPVNRSAIFAAGRCWHGACLGDQYGVEGQLQDCGDGWPEQGANCHDGLR